MITSTLKNRCQKCRMLQALCICAEIEPISIQTKIAILMHSCEEQKSTNTVRLLKLAIPETQITLFGRLGVRDEINVPADVQPLVLFPEPSAPILTSDFISRFDRPILLMVPDGTWGQARKLIHKRENLLSIPRVRIARTEPSRYLLRRSQHENGLCTLEAVAEALGVLEGNHVKVYLESLLQIMVQRTMKSRSGIHRAKQALRHF